MKILFFRRLILGAGVGVLVTLMCFTISYVTARHVVKMEIKAKSEDPSELRTAISTIVSFSELSAIYGPAKQTLPCVTEQIPTIRAKSTLASLQEAFVICKDDVRKSTKILSNAPDGFVYATFVGIVASRLTDYGSGEPVKNLRDIFTNDAVNCGSQSILLYTAVKSAYPDLVVRHVGVQNIAIGNHSFVSVSDGANHFIYDPTASIVARTKLDALLEGHPVGVYDMTDFYERNDEYLEMFRRKLRGALRNGAIRQQDILYNNLVDDAYIAQWLKE